MNWKEEFIKLNIFKVAIAAEDTTNADLAPSRCIKAYVKI